MAHFDSADTSVGTELIVACKELTCPPSSTRSVIRRSHLNITTAADTFVIPFCPSPTPKSASFPTLPSSFSKPPPEVPPKWLWRCHLCGLSYSLGTTRRCLNDGHYFCAGTTINKRTGKRKTHSPCGSTFDYIGWQEYGDWRRHEQDLRAKARRRSASVSAPQKLFHTGEVKAIQSTSTNDNKKDFSPTINSGKSAQNCEHNCNFPSECRWSAKLTPPCPDATKRKSTKTISTPEPDNTPDPDASRSPIPSTKEEENPTKEFQLSKRSTRRQKSFSLPFSSYSWLAGPDAGPDAAGLTSLADGGVSADTVTREGDDDDDRLWLMPVL